MEWVNEVATVGLDRIGLMICLGALAALMANRGIAVFHDGLRALVPEYQEGRMSRKALAASSFALSFGLVIGFGLPFSLTAPVILIHSLLLGTDVIGTWCPDNKKGSILAVILGGIYGGALLLGLKSVVELFKLMPVDVMLNLSKVGDPIIVTFSLFPAVVVGYQYGYKKAIWVLIATLIAYQVTSLHGVLNWGGKEVKIDPNGIALLVSMVAMLYFAMREKPAEGSSGSNAMLVGLFSDRINRIKQNQWIMILNGGFTAMAASMSMSLIAEGPVSLALIAEGEGTSAMLVALARAISFIPLVGTTSIATGVYSPDGMKFVFVAGLATNNLFIAFIAGCLIMFMEIQLLARIAVWLDNYPGVKACGDHIRSAMTKMLEVSLLVGGMIASNAILPGLGFMVVAGIYLLNRSSKRPLVEMAIGPIATIIVGVLANLLVLVGLN